MPDYKEMYRALFSETTKAISILQKAQQRTEEMYITDDSTEKQIVSIRSRLDEKEASTQR